MREAELQMELLRCAISNKQSGTAQWGSLLEKIDLEDCSYRVRRLLPAVKKNLALQHSMADRMYEQAVHRNRNLVRACQEVVSLFNDHGIDVMVLKGIVLNRWVHEDQGVRPAHDFDLLVPHSQAEKAIELLYQEGWKSVGEQASPADRLENATEFTKDKVKLDLHWFLLKEARAAWSDDVFWSCRIPFDLDGVPTFTLSLPHQCFHLFAVAFREPHHLVRYLYDLKAFLDRYAEEVDFSELEQLLAERHLLSRWQSLPLQTIEWAHLRPQRTPTLFDRMWSLSTRHRHDLWGEFGYALFPFLDYRLHFRHSESSFPNYLKRRLELQGLGDLATRVFRKLWRW